MDHETLLAGALQGIADVTPQVTSLIRSLSDPHLVIPGSEWDAREVSIHLTQSGNMYAEIATGTPSPRKASSTEYFAEASTAAIADIAETDPEKLALLLETSIERVLSACAGRRGDQHVTFHAGSDFHLGGLIAIRLGEYLLHGFDVACAARRAWSINPDHAAVVLAGMLPIGFALCPNRTATAGLNASYALDLSGHGGLNIRYTDGTVTVADLDSSDAECVIEADPVAFLLAFSGRISPWAAITLGLIAPSDRAPDLAANFWNLFVFP